MAAPTTVEEYLAGLPEDRRAGVEQLRWAVNAAAPGATETIAYGMPALRSHGGQFLVSYAAYKQHYSLFPASGAVVEALGDALTPYLAGKGTIQFKAADQLPLALVTRIVKIRFAEDRGAARGRCARSPARHSRSGNPAPVSVGYERGSCNTKPARSKAC